ncbi:hypothetical protein GQ600_4175 [Phytophthora cactorum]|nr:hypothetical protein GQ600_4175 [Phytophthora cactorum]
MLAKTKEARVEKQVKESMRRRPGTLSRSHQPIIPGLRDEVEELTLQVGRMGTPRPVERNLSAELDEGADEDEDNEEHGGAQGGRLSFSESDEERRHTECQ